MVQFACEHCGSPAIALSTDLTDESEVRCLRCKALLGTWGTFKTTIEHALSLEADRSGPVS
jgi:hypothetical protein